MCVCVCGGGVTVEVGMGIVDEVMVTIEDGVVTVDDGVVTLQNRMVRWE